MLSTAEVRWFEQGEIPDHILDWFERGSAMLQPEPPRVDEYLRVRDTDGLGIKFREGRLEIKQRYGQAAVVTFAPSATGTVELWRKWGFELAEPVEGREVLKGVDAWVSVRKERWLSHYGVRCGGTLERLPTLASPATGCSVELTRVNSPHIRLRDQVWWTLGFEAIGGESELVDTLATVARHVLRSAAGMALSAEISYGYPRWLQLVTG